MVRKIPTFYEAGARAELRNHQGVEMWYEESVDRLSRVVYATLVAQHTDQSGETDLLRAVFHDAMTQGKYAKMSEEAKAQLSEFVKDLIDTMSLVNVTQYHEKAAFRAASGSEPIEITHLARDLETLMSNISERCWCAGWMEGTSDFLWRTVLTYREYGARYILDNRPTWGQGHVQLGEVFQLDTLSRKLGGWIRPREETDPNPDFAEFVSLEVWWKSFKEGSYYIPGQDDFYYEKWFLWRHDIDPNLFEPFDEAQFKLLRSKDCACLMTDRPGLTITQAVHTASLSIQMFPVLFSKVFVEDKKDNVPLLVFLFVPETSSAQVAGFSDKLAEILQSLQSSAG